MKIAILGAGNVGSALAKNWRAVGHDIAFGVRNPDSPKSQKAVEDLPDVALKNIGEAAAWADALVVTTPPEAALELAAQLGDVQGKTIIDATKAVRTRPDPYPTAYHALRELAIGAHVVKCFNSTGYENMADPRYGSESADMFMAGDSPEAKQVARQLALDAGFGECYDFGDGSRVQLLEQFALAWINLAIFQGMGRGVAFKLMRR